MTRSRTRSRRTEPQPPVIVDVKDVPIVLLPDPGHSWPIEFYANTFGYNLAEGREIEHFKVVQGASWRNGPGWFPVSVDEWRTRIIIVPKPVLFDFMHDDSTWRRFVNSATELAGREPREDFDCICFDRP